MSPPRRFQYRDARIAELWAAGKLRREICATLKLTDGIVGSALRRMRRRGEPIARRPTGVPPNLERRADLQRRVQAGESNAAIGAALGIKPVTVRGLRRRLRQVEPAIATVPAAA